MYCVLTLRLLLGCECVGWDAQAHFGELDKNQGFSDPATAQVRPAVSRRRPWKKSVTTWTGQVPPSWVADGAVLWWGMVPRQRWTR